MKRTKRMQHTERAADHDPILLHHEVLELVNTRRETLWRWRREGLFPTGFRINRRGDLGWRKSEVKAWLTRRDQGELIL